VSAAQLYPPAQPDGPPLRVGVMLDSWAPAAWAARVLENVQSSGFATVCVVIMNDGAPRQHRSVAQRLSGKLRGLRTLFWTRYLRRDQRRHPDLHATFTPRDVRQTLADAEVIHVTPLREGFVHRFEPRDVERVRNQRLDVILRFGFNIVRGEILNVANHGIWSYHHGDNHRYRGGPAGFWEMYERSTVTGVILQILTDDLDAGQVICRSHCATHSFDSLLRNRAPLYRTGIPFVMRCLRELRNSGRLKVEPPGPQYTRGLYRAPSNWCMASFRLRSLANSVKSRIGAGLGAGGDHWELAVVQDAHARPESLRDSKVIKPPAGHFWADPCIVRRDGRQWVFFEDMSYAHGRGRISVLELKDDLSHGPEQVVLEEPWHLSYPFVFQWQGVDYMVPESAQHRSVRLYRATEFPFRWEFERVLLDDIHAVDATLHEQDGVWYLFTNVSEAGGSSWNELFLFTATTPFGPWSPHPANPLVSDVRWARPAGALFRKDGVLYRPAQDCSGTYGTRIAVNRVDKLSASEYGESLAYFIEPAPAGWIGCHTISIGDGITVLDGKLRPSRRSLLGN
jgi:hypothetical protein